MIIAVVLGTRPEIIKMAPVIRECQRKKLDYFVLHTGQHYTYSMDRIFFDQLDLPQPKYNLDIGSGSHAQQTGKILASIEKVLLEEQPEIVLVEGDTNTVMAAALAASKMNINVGHVEAGLRSYDRRMPEEINRVVADHVSDYLFAPTATSKKNLLEEGIAEEKIYVTGNTIVDSVYQNLQIAKKKVDVLPDFNLKSKEYFLVTSHRQENVDRPERFLGIIQGLELIAREFSFPIIFPIHPRTSKMVDKFGLELEGLEVIDPLGFLEFLQLEAKARLVLTDSGGVQEETCILGVPGIPMRDNTERPETLAVGANILVGTEPLKILNGAKKMLEIDTNLENPFGDGTAGARIVQIVQDRIESGS
jgi:UDP-N-acetylglucosamine 2-epimerase (non-hydrolysing)